eukprot:2663307-Rhodomonas_salina.1
MAEIAARHRSNAANDRKPRHAVVDVDDAHRTAAAGRPDPLEGQTSSLGIGHEVRAVEAPQAPLATGQRAQPHAVDDSHAGGIGERAAERDGR